LYLFLFFALKWSQNGHKLANVVKYKNYAPFLSLKHHFSWAAKKRKE